MAESGAATFTEAVAELEAAGFTSAGFGIEDGTIVCMECGEDETVADVSVGGMLRYQNAAGEGHVFALGCKACAAKGLLFVAHDADDGSTAVIIEQLENIARS